MFGKHYLVVRIPSYYIIERQLSISCLINLLYTRIRAIKDIN